VPKSYLYIPVPDFIVRSSAWLLLLYRKIRFGCAFRKIPLTQGKFAVVDPEDFQKLNAHKWFVKKSGNNIFYAIRAMRRVNGRKKNISMHRQIMGATPPGLVIDHKDSNGLNNTKENLRIVTSAQNIYNNRKTAKKTSSKYKGVCYKKQKNKYCATIGHHGHRKFLGYFENETDAAKTYDQAAKKLFGQFAKLNFD
jgi:hypothetical protein